MSGMSNVWKHWLGPVRIPWEEGKIKWTTCRTLGESVTTAGWVWFWVPTCAAPPSGGLVCSPLPRWLLRVGLAHPGISSGHSPAGMFALSPAPPSLQIQPILPSPSLPFHSWYQPFQNFTCAQSSSKMGIHQPRSWHSSWAETLLCSSSYQAWHPVAVLDNLQRRATPQINFTQICFRWFPKARSKPVNW